MSITQPGQEHSLDFATSWSQPRLGLIRAAEPLAARHFYYASTKGYMIASLLWPMFYGVSAGIGRHPRWLMSTAPACLCVTYVGCVIAKTRRSRQLAVCAASTSGAATLAFTLAPVAPGCVLRLSILQVLNALWLWLWCYRGVRVRRDPPLLVATLGMIPCAILAGSGLAVCIPGSLGGDVASILGPVLLQVFYTLLLQAAWERQEGLCKIGPSSGEALWLTMVPCQH